MGFTFRKKNAASLLIGDHPRMAPLKTLNIRDDAIFTAWFPSSNGILDDYFESWFISESQAIESAPEGLESVTPLGLSEEWLPAPDREAVDQELLQRGNP
jgi:hypothetical protein